MAGTRRAARSGAMPPMALGKLNFAHHIAEPISVGIDVIGNAGL